MTLKEFIESVDEDSPPAGLPQTLTALWWDRKGEWAHAHSEAQNIHDSTGSRIHAYLHRKEGDLGNADYWYARAGRRRPAVGLEEEWRGLAEELLESSGRPEGGV